ncbi:MAG: AI-2E family transporter [Ignavibacteriales bacterium]|nr:AI-2E family transporter [Ignavibacteriales bacterium]
MQPFTANRPFLKVSVLLAVLLAAFWVTSLVPMLTIALILSTLVAFILKPLVKLLEFRLGLRRSISILCVFLLTGGALVLVSIEVVPLLMNRALRLYDQFKTFPFQEKLNIAAADLARHIPFLDAEVIASRANQFIAGGVEAIGKNLENIVPLIAMISIVPFITYFVLAEGDVALKRMIERVPNKYFEMTLNVLNKIQRDLVGYLRGWILDSLIIGILSMAGLWLLGIDYPILIGALAGVANLVPYLGPVVGAVPAFLVSLTQFGDFRMLLPIVLLTVAIQAIDNVIVQPLCFAKTVDMHPLTVILVLIVGNELMGILGMLLAIPIATILKVSTTETYWGLKNYRITAS